MVPAPEQPHPVGLEPIPTASTGLRCGFYALIGSMEAQHPGLPQPTLEDLDQAFRSEEVAAANSEFGLDNTDNFRADQLAAVIRHWASRNAINIQLGVDVDGGDSYLIPIPAGIQSTPITLWIHNNNAEELDGASMSHYSAMAPLPPATVDPEELLKQQETGALKSLVDQTGIRKYLSEYYGLSAEEVGQLLIDRDLLGGARYDKARPCNDAFVGLVSKAIGNVRCSKLDNVPMMSHNASIVLSASTDEEWAREIDEYTPEAIKQFVLAPEPPSPQDFMALQRVHTSDFGVYCCFLLGVGSDVHHHLYVGSAAGIGGLDKRKKDRDTPNSVENEGNLLARLLWDGKPREAHWFTLVHILGSQRVDDPISRTHLRFLAVLAEAVFHDLLAAWRYPDRNKNCPWHDSPKPMEWWGLNTNPPLLGSGVTFASFSQNLDKARRLVRCRKENMPPERHEKKLARQRARDARIRAAETEADVEERRKNYRAKYARMDPEKKAARLQRQYEAIRRKQANETPEERRKRMDAQRRRSQKSLEKKRREGR